MSVSDVVYNELVYNMYILLNDFFVHSNEVVVEQLWTVDKLFGAELHNMKMLCNLFVGGKTSARHMWQTLL